MNSPQTMTWTHLAPKPGSAYQQLFVKGTRIAARLLYGLHVNEEEPMTLEEIAAGYNLPLDAVREAVDYCRGNPPEIALDWQREEAHVQARVGSELTPPALIGSPRFRHPRQAVDFKKEVADENQNAGV